MNYNFLGANIDTRLPEKKQKDFSFVEIVAAANPVDWKTKPESEWRKFPDQDQNGSGSCVANTIKKLALINLWLKEKTFVTFSATHIYQRRSNRPSPGMIGVEAFDLWRDGITLEALAPSELKNDAEMDNFFIEQYKRDIGKVFSIGNHIGLPIKDIDAVASVIQTTGKGVMTWFYFTHAEWSPAIPKVIDPDLNLYGEGTSRHSVAVVDFFIYEGKKALLIEDSAHFGGITRRIITEDFFKARNWFTRYPMNFKFQDPTLPLPDKPKYQFNNKLVFIALTPIGNISDPILHSAQEKDVKALQDILKYENLFPSNTTSTGYYGAITAKAILAFQKKHKIASDQELESLQGRLVGPATRAKLNSLYA